MPYKIVLVLVTILLCMPKIAGEDKVSLDNVLKQLERLSKSASYCMESKDRKSKSCKAFARDYKDGGSEAIKAFNNNLETLFKSNPESVINSSSNAITIGNAVLFMADKTKRNN